MSHSHAKLDEEHRCIAAKCKGKLHDDPKEYGRYAYWRNGKDGWAWYATPSKTVADIRKEFEAECIRVATTACAALEELPTDKRTVRHSYDLLGGITSMFDVVLKEPKDLGKRFDLLQEKFEGILG